jgi:tetratricopeptide (TPR) repeat protein
MAERPDSESKVWSAFRESSADAGSDSLLDLYTNLDAVGSDDSIGAGFVALEKLLEENRFEQAAFVARSLGTELANRERFDESIEVVDKALNFGLWLSDFEIGMLYYVNGRNYLGRQQFAQAELVLQQSVGILELQHERFAGFASKELAEVRIKLGTFDDALKAFTCSVSLMEACGETGSVGHVKRRLGEVLMERNQLLMSEKYLRDAVSILTFAEWTEEKSSAELALGRLLIELREFEEAAEIFERLVSQRSEARLMPIAAEASLYLHKNKIASGAGPLLKSELDALSAVLTAAGLLDLADSMHELLEVFPNAQTESKRNNPEIEMTQP